MVSNPPLRILIDLNVILDVLAQRQPHDADAHRLWAAIESGQVQGFVAAHSLTTLFYLLRRHTSQAQARAALVDVLHVFSVAAVDQAVIQAAMALAWPDFEDAVQMAAAAQCNAVYVITRNLEDFKNGPVPVLTAPNFLAVLETG
ncbi:MAG: PIN domain-containing protein [Chloroflexota bacterium]